MEKTIIASIDLIYARICAEFMECQADLKRPVEMNTADNLNTVAKKKSKLIHIEQSISCSILTKGQSDGSPFSKEDLENCEDSNSNITVHPSDSSDSTTKCKIEDNNSILDTKNNFMFPDDYAIDLSKYNFLPKLIVKNIIGEWIANLISQSLSTIHENKGHFTNCNHINREIHLISVVLDFTWENLNTGDWKDVHPSWQLVYTWSSIALAILMTNELKFSCINISLSESLSHIKDVIIVCDRGLIMGHPIPNSPLHKVANLFNKLYYSNSNFQSSELQDKIKFEDVSQFTHLLVNRLPEKSLPDLNEFLLNHMQAGKPVKLLNIVDHWPAMQKWNFEYFLKIAGARTVPIEIGHRYTDEDWSQSLMTMEDFIASYINSGQVGYLAQHQLMDQIPELRDDLHIPDYCCFGDSQQPRIQAWIGPKDTVSPLHHDPEHNILVQVFGYKYIRLYGKNETVYLYPHDESMLSNTSQVDLDCVDKIRFPNFQKATCCDLVLGPGEALYIPPLCWHYVRALSGSCSVSFWWKCQWQ